MGMGRIETGVVQFGDDWPGIFIRGDNADHYAMIAKIAADRTDDPRTQEALRQLMDLLLSCNAKTATNIQRVPSSARWYR